MTNWNKFIIIGQLLILASVCGGFYLFMKGGVPFDVAASIERLNQDVATVTDILNSRTELIEGIDNTTEINQQNILLALRELREMLLVNRGISASNNAILRTQETNRDLMISHAQALANDITESTKENTVQRLAATKQIIEALDRIEKLLLESRK